VEVRTSIEIDAPRERVFEVLLDLDDLGNWVEAHRAIVEEPDGPLREGSTFRQKLRVSGLGFKVRWTVTRIERPKVVEWQGEGPGGSDARVCYSLSEADEGTRFDYVNEFNLPGGKLAERAGKLIGEDRAREEANSSLRSLKELIEGGKA
jgi:carbon monoxide dehydrogenase subunit G